MKDQFKLFLTALGWRNAFICLLLLFFAACKNTKKEGAFQSLPVYQVVQSDASDTVAKVLYDKFKIPSDKWVVRNGSHSYTDIAKYLSVPLKVITDPAVLKALKNNSKGEAKGVMLKYEAIQFDSLQYITVLNSDTALKLAASVFAAAGLHPDSARPLVGHTNLSAAYKGTNGKTVSVSQPLDTRVSYDFYDKSGHQFTGPGAVFTITFNSNEQVTQFYSAWREIKAGRSVRIIPDSMVKRKIRELQLLPDDAKIEMKLVYWCPPLTNASGKKTVKTIIPWYAFTGIIERRNSNGSISTTRTQEQLIPATDDTEFVPSASLKVHGKDSKRVDAAVAVMGGHPPYLYSWSGSNPAILLNDSDSVVSYQPLMRTVDTIGIHHVTENVSVIVADANGILARVTPQALSVIAHPVDRYVTVRDSFGVNGQPGAIYGCESPGDFKWGYERQAWQQSMANSGAGTQAFCWTDLLSWPGDYIEPPVPGSSPQQGSPWIYGDADYSNWGINSANLVMIFGDGAPDYFYEMYPGSLPPSESSDPTAAQLGSVYGRTFLYTPTNAAGTVCLPPFYSVNYNQSWGATKSKNPQLYWLSGFLCQCLDSLDADGKTTAQRWGPAFGGLHIFTGFEGDAAPGTGFPVTFAQNILGVTGATGSTGATGQAQTIVQAWFNASNDNTEGTAAAMGPITTGNCSDIGDYYIGQGTQGLTISPSAITGWWYLTSNFTTPATYAPNNP